MSDGPAAVENSVTVPQKLNIELSFDPESPFLGIYTKQLKVGIQTGFCTPMFKQHYSQYLKHGTNPNVHQ